MHIGLHRSFVKKFKRLPKPIQQKFIERKNLFIGDPFNPLLNNHSVDRAFRACRSINVTGDYRAIFKEEGTGITFLMIGSHAELYGK